MPCSRTVLVRSALAPWRASAARCSASSSIRRTSTAPCRAGRVRVAISGPPRKPEAVLSVDLAGLPAMVGVITSAWPTSAGWQAYPPPP